MHFYLDLIFSGTLLVFYHLKDKILLLIDFFNNYVIVFLHLLSYKGLRYGRWMRILNRCVSSAEVKKIVI